MIGQIVEIPYESLVYQKEKPVFLSKEEELFWRVEQRRYSLFDGFIVGEHNGVEGFEIGQRKGLNVSGKKLPVYVIGIDEHENRLFVGQGKDHPGLFCDVFLFTDQNINWLTQSIDEEEIDVEVTSSILREKKEAKFYQFGEKYFLEFNIQIPLILKNYTIELSCNKTNFIKLNK
ncbi:hypothetical protein OBK28_00450 [Empedobacter falsenii]|uniref:tRNA-specific 2-thiouridylase MnmA-like central domain-containing protein n=1 Tax=Empedobacter falsenii TaxID=343874 RepID=A0ABY8V8V0_9FLAO|nr:MULTISPECIES: tRNA methyl transferase PRC-barrel domain-containing protein [Empedobacter]MCA4781506.1 hypothetical protein [Empedobacter stercoris]MDM1524232.1 hypothetical protein [Empedobacter sp. 225-1]MDM1544148.1 hypothetical protein [Empedobacter sp. 189-2]WIH98116.1 hypothetical protein OBA43_04055 [Empedobacter falsenii]HJD86027.1 hypothetical protein [Empedobacter falsenii]